MTTSDQATDRGRPDWHKVDWAPALRELRGSSPLSPRTIVMLRLGLRYGLGDCQMWPLDVGEAIVDRLAATAVAPRRGW